MSYQREFPRRLRIGLVGAGMHAYRNILPALHYLPVQLMAVCDRDGERASVTAAEYGCRPYTDAEAMYDAENLEAVLLVVGPAQHPDLACQAFSRGLHVWMEKPPGMCAADVERMIAARSDRAAAVGFKKVFMPSTEKALEIIRSPQHGGLRTMLAVYPMEVPPDGAAVLAERRFTNWLGNGCHPLSLLIAAGEASGGEPVRVTTLRGGAGGGVVWVELSNGVSATLQLASGPQPIEAYSFFAARWHLHIDNSLTVTLQRGYPFDYNRTAHYCPEGVESGAVRWEPQNCLATLENRALFTQGFHGELMEFCRCALEGRAVERGSLEFTLRIMKVYEAALLSDGTPVAVQT
jgi:predicted dehydrogenase